MQSSLQIVRLNQKLQQAFRPCGAGARFFQPAAGTIFILILLRISIALEVLLPTTLYLSTPLATILLALLGVPLSRSSPRRGKYARVTTAVVIFAVYYNLSALVKKWVERGVLDTMPGICWTQLLLAALLVILLWRRPLAFFRRRR